jgi:hypothetical protein
MSTLCIAQELLLVHNVLVCLGALAKLRKATLSFVIFFRPPAWNNSTSTGRLFMKCHVARFFLKLGGENQIFIKTWQEERVLHKKTYVGL